MTKQTPQIQKLTESAVMTALAVALCEISGLLPWPFLQGGSVTLFGMVPILVIAYRHGIRQGLLTAVVFGGIEMMFGLKNFSYVTGIAAYIILALMDYLVAFGVMGLGGVFRDKIRHNQKAELIAGGVLCCVLRFICHYISGMVIWSGYCPAEQNLFIYNLIYNGGYMLPETVLTVIGLAAVGSLFDFRKKRIG